ncbi:MAG TPA: lactate utilization protein B [Acidimicrobiia bacterium]|nr:lactate utilization protein B [Acidimicrobiia bacterium]
MSRLADRARAAVADPKLQDALGNLTGLLSVLARSAAADPTLTERRERAKEVRRETLADLDGWLARLEAKLTEQGAVVHHADGPSEACRVVADLVRAEGVEVVVKGKSMATEEIHLNRAIEAAGAEVWETDLGEYIVQLAGEPPSHIVGPALHKRIPEIADLFSEVVGRELPHDAEVLCAVAREVLREKFFAAGMGITGANFAAADTGTIVLVTNEGNGRMCSSLPRIHVVIMPVEKVVPRLADVADLVPVLTRWASGQPLTTYVSMITGPARPGDVDGPEQLHVVFLDHNRRALAGTDYEEMLACVRCGACLNVCPVYGRIGGHAYDSVYPGPMGSVLTPLLSRGAEGHELPDASSLCGACTEACPVGIPLADMLVHLRADLRRPRAAAWAIDAPRRAGRRRPSVFGLWSRAWSTPGGYRLTTATARRVARLVARAQRRDGWVASMPGASGWASQRDVPVPPASSFRDRWAARQRGDLAGWQG